MKTSILAVVASSIVSTLTSAQLIPSIPKPTCPCYTATKTVTPASCPTFTKVCIVPMCIRLETQWIPGPDPRCPKTPTSTYTRPCQTACTGGCATTTQTATGPISCPSLPTSVKTPTPTPTQIVGKLGDRCSTFTTPPDPPCGPGLGCVLDNPLLPDMGGKCLATPGLPIISPLLNAIKLPSVSLSPLKDAIKLPTISISPLVDPLLALNLPGISISPGKIAIPGGASSPPIPTPTVGLEGAGCGAFTWPPQPNCGQGLVCVMKNPQIPDIGGTCLRRGKEGDACNRYKVEPDPACAPGLTCVTIDPRIPDLGGICRRAVLTTIPTIARPTVLSTVRSVVGQPVPSSVRPVINVAVRSTVRSVVASVAPARVPTSLLTRPRAVSTAPPPRSRPCYTKTVSAWRACPEDSWRCRPYDCITLTTKLVPTGPVAGCPYTPVVTNTRRCLSRCDGGCSTQVVTRPTPW